MLPPEAGIHSWHLLHDAALSQGVAHSAGYPGELSAKVTRKIFPRVTAGDLTPMSRTTSDGGFASYRAGATKPGSTDELR